MLSRRILLWAGMLVFAFVLVVGTVWLMKRPAVYAGDRVETRDCRDCGGTGVMGDYMEGEPQPGMPSKEGPCVTCGGRKTVQVILPGPNHPAWVKGTVVDAALVAEGDAGLLDERLAGRGPMEPVPGAIPQATVVFERGGQKVEVHSANSGRIRAQLPPGTWKVSATAAGFSSYSGQVDVPPRTSPIYVEEARTLRPEEDDQEVPLQIRLSRSAGS